MHPVCADDPSGIAGFLLERRGVLDRALRQMDLSPSAAILSRNPPSPIALVAMDDPAGRQRLVQLLQAANIDFVEAAEPDRAMALLELTLHAVLFTDQIEVIRGARALPVGAATHIVFVNNPGRSVSSEAWRAGAHDCMPAEIDGEEFWAHLTTARRIIGLAGSLNLALADNRILSTVDALTRCGSRRFFEKEFPREVERAIRLDRPLSLVMCDIDYFKRINDDHGHPIGDDVLSEFGDRLNDGLRLGVDWLARIGGEEFATVLPETSPDEGFVIAERLRTRVTAKPFQTRSEQIVVTASFGICGLHGQQPCHAEAAESLLKAADAALYESKRRGRNLVTRGCFTLTDPSLRGEPASRAHRCG